MQRDYSGEIRKYIYDSCELINHIFNNIETDYYDMFYDSLWNMDYNNYLHFLVGEDTNISDPNILKGMSLLMRTQLFTDYYISLKAQDKLYNTKSLENLPSINSYDDIVSLSYDDNAKKEMLESTLDFDIMNDFDRTLLFKSLDKKDVEYLKKINPFFKKEYDEYNKEIKLDFINDGISKIQEVISIDKNVSYNLASRFIFDLYHINKKEAEKLLIELFRQDLGIYSKDIINDEEEIIKMGQINLNIEGLQYMLKDYYLFSNKVLKNKWDDIFDR